jgi:hypothetical protein
MQYTYYPLAYEVLNDIMTVIEYKVNNAGGVNKWILLCKAKCKGYA